MTKSTGAQEHHRWCRAWQGGSTQQKLRTTVYRVPVQRAILNSILYHNRPEAIALYTSVRSPVLGVTWWPAGLYQPVSQRPTRTHHHSAHRRIQPHSYTPRTAIFNLSLSPILIRCFTISSHKAFPMRMRSYPKPILFCPYKISHPYRKLTAAGLRASSEYGAG
jgi:hypothetical protein